MFDQKDSDRISSIILKRDPLAAAQQMASVIKDSEKALRRAEAAESMCRVDLAKVFRARYNELTASLEKWNTPKRLTVGVPSRTRTVNRVTVEVKGVTFSAKKAAKPRVYFFDESKTNVLDMMEQRWTPSTLLAGAIREVLEPLGLGDAKVKWSQRAGCSCPCSPGFVVDNARYQFDVYVDYILKAVK